MSRKNQAKHSVSVANNKLGGARVTRSQRHAVCSNFVDWAFENGFIFNSLRDVSVEAVTAFVAEKQASGVSNATLHNRLASIRRAMKALGVEPDAMGLTAKTVGLAPRRRDGKKAPIPDQLFADIVATAHHIGEPGFANAITLQRLLGLRGLESVMSVPDLERFAQDAYDISNVEAISINRGTKGGRPRVTRVIASRAQETLIAIRDALVFARQNGGHLISGESAGLKSARARYHRVAAKVGLIGKYSPHSIRYAYAVEKIVEMRDAGYSRTEVLALVSTFLGHGPSRGRFVTMVYGRTVVHTLKQERRKPRIDRAITNLENLVFGVGQSDSALPDR